MSHQFDVTLKESVQEDVTGFAARFGLDVSKPMKYLGTDLSTLSAATDAAIAIGDPIEEIADLNFQSGPDPNLPQRVHLYNAALRFKFAVPIRSIIVLLRPKADHPSLTGLIASGEGEHRLEFHYRVIRVWREPAESFLNDSVGLLPLAVLGQVPSDRPIEESTKEVLRQIEPRLLAETQPERAAVLMKATVILANLRFDKDSLSRILQGVGLMGEIAAADYFAELGELKGRRETLIQQGRRKFGRSDSDAERSLSEIADLERLQRMADSILTADSWEEFLETP